MWDSFILSVLPDSVLRTKLTVGCHYEYFLTLHFVSPAYFNVATNVSIVDYYHIIYNEKLTFIYLVPFKYLVELKVPRATRKDMVLIHPSVLKKCNLNSGGLVRIRSATKMVIY